MSQLKFILFFILLSLSSLANAKNEKTEIPTEDKWGQTADGNHSLSSIPSLFKDVNFVNDLRLYMGAGATAVPVVERHGMIEF